MSDIITNREPETAQSPLQTPAASSAYTILSVPISQDGPEREVWLSPPQQSALECLFNGGSVSAAARAAGVTRQTVNKWIRANHDFKTVYEAWHREIQKNVKDRLAAIGDAAMDNITEAIQIHGDLRASQFVVKHLLDRKGASAEK